MPLRSILASLLLCAQGVGIIAARFGPERYFCWAPYDEITLFEITVVLGSRILAPEEVQARYQLPDPRRDNRSWAHVPRAISQYERTLGAQDNAYVRFSYAVNGGPPSSGPGRSQPALRGRFGRDERRKVLRARPPPPAPHQCYPRDSRRDSSRFGARQIAAPSRPPAPTMLPTPWILKIWSHHPLVCEGSSMPPAMLLAAKLVVLDRCFDRFYGGFHAPFLPFWSMLEHPHVALIWSRLLGMLFVSGALLLLFNVAPRLGAGCAGGALLLDTLAGRLRFSNSALLFDLILIVAALSSPDDRARIVLRVQLFLVYFGATLNKLLHPDWHDGQYFVFWTREILHLDWFTQIDSLAGGRLSVFMGWLTIGIEGTLAGLVLWTRQTRIFLALGLAFHVGMLVFTGGVLSWVFLHTMLLAFLPFWKGAVSPTALEVASTPPIRALLAWPVTADVRPRLAHAAFAAALVCFC